MARGTDRRRGAGAGAARTVRELAPITAVAGAAALLVSVVVGGTTADVAAPGLAAAPGIVVPAAPVVDGRVTVRSAPRRAAGATAVADAIDGLRAIVLPRRSPAVIVAVRPGASPVRASDGAGRSAVVPPVEDAAVELPQAPPAAVVVPVPVPAPSPSTVQLAAASTTAAGKARGRSAAAGSAADRSAATRSVGASSIRPGPAATEPVEAMRPSLPPTAAGSPADDDDGAAAADADRDAPGNGNGKANGNGNGKGNGRARGWGGQRGPS